MKQKIKNVQGMTIGEITTLPDGRQVAKSPTGLTVGTYDPGVDRTTEATGQTHSRGNTLASILEGLRK